MKEEVGPGDRTNLKGTFLQQGGDPADEQRPTDHQHRFGGRGERKSGQANYVAAKAGVIGMTKAMARAGPAADHGECGRSGFIETDMTAVLG